jgi:hypothetical protein
VRKRGRRKAERVQDRETETEVDWERRYVYTLDWPSLLRPQHTIELAKSHCDLSARLPSFASATPVPGTSTSVTSFPVNTTRIHATHTHTHAHIHTHTPTQQTTHSTHSHTNTFTHFHTHKHTFSHSHTFTFTPHSHIHTNKKTNTHTHTHTHVDVTLTAPIISIIWHLFTSRFAKP